MTSSSASEAELLLQREQVEADFRDGWVPRDVDEPRVLTDSAYTAARKIVEEGGWTGLDRSTIQAVRNGARPGDPLPQERKPFIDRVTNVQVIIIGSGPEGRVAVLFSHDHFPGIRFGHRLSLPSDRDARLALLWLKEQIETGALHRMMRDQPVPDDAGIIWTMAS